jgi:hypothetical protein
MKEKLNTLRDVRVETRKIAVQYIDNPDTYLHILGMLAFNCALLFDRLEGRAAILTKYTIQLDASTMQMLHDLCREMKVKPTDFVTMLVRDAHAQLQMAKSRIREMEKRKGNILPHDE